MMQSDATARSPRPLPISASGPSFASLQPSLSPWITDHLASLSFNASTPVQASTLPLLLKHKDVIVEAVTGSGKTLAYLLPLLELIRKQPQLPEDTLLPEEEIAIAERDDGIKALVLLPTRELAIQVYTVLLSLLESAPSSVRSYLRPQLVVGGGQTSHHTASQKGQEEEDDGVGAANTPQQDFARLRKERNNIVIGTPGRVEGLFAKGIIKAKAKTMEILVLDEADRLLDLGFLASLTSILAALPKQRRTALFSATMSDALDQLVRLGLRNPVRVTVRVEMKKQISILANGKAGPGTSAAADNIARIPASLQNFFLVSPHHHKIYQLVRLLQHEPQEYYTQKIVVFFATCAQVEYFYKVLSAIPQLSHCHLYSLHGRQNPTRRTRAFESFLSDNASVASSSKTALSSASVLLCTDVASRGLDMPKLDLVVQFDPPQDPNLFNHRIGRTARAGKSGRAICLLAEGSEESYIDFLRLRGVRGERYAFPQEAKTNGKEDSVKSLSDALRKETLADLATHDLLKLAIVSFVRAYGKHEASYLFPKKELDAQLKEVARSWGAVRMPKMGELRVNKAGGRDHQAADGGVNREAEAEGWLDGRVDEVSWAYKDAAKEKARQLKLNQTLSRAKASRHKKDRRDDEVFDNGDGDAGGEGEEGDEGDDPSTPTTPTSASTRKRMRGAQEATLSAWSKQKAAKDRREERKDKKRRKRCAIERERQAGERKDGAGQADDDDDDDDDDEVFAEEEREMRRLRRAKRRVEARLAGERGVKGEAKTSGSRALDGDTGFQFEDDGGGSDGRASAEEGSAGDVGGGGGDNFFDGL